MVDHKQALLNEGWTERSDGSLTPPNPYESYREALNAYYFERGSRLRASKPLDTLNMSAIWCNLVFASKIPVTNKMVGKALAIFSDTRKGGVGTLCVTGSEKFEKMRAALEAVFKNLSPLKDE